MREAASSPRGRAHRALGRTGAGALLARAHRRRLGSARAASMSWTPPPGRAHVLLMRRSPSSRPRASASARATSSAGGLPDDRCPPRAAPRTSAGIAHCASTTSSAATHAAHGGGGGGVGSRRRGTCADRGRGRKRVERAAFSPSSDARFEQSFSLKAYDAGIRVAYLPRVSFKTRAWTSTPTSCPPHAALRRAGGRGGPLLASHVFASFSHCCKRLTFCNLLIWPRARWRG